MDEGNREDMEAVTEAGEGRLASNDSHSTADPSASCPSTSDPPKPQESTGAREKRQGAGGSRGKEPVCLLILGMAGSGKTSLVRRLDAHLNVRRPHYTINLDPAVDSVPYISYIDIRDTVNYKEVSIFKADSTG